MRSINLFSLGVCRLLAAGWACTAMLLACTPLAAQEPATPPAEAPAADDPFDAPAAAPAADMPAEEPPPDDFGAPAEPAPGFDDEAPAAKPKPRAEAEPDVPLPEPAPEPNPAVDAVLESNPRTPFELLRAVRILADLGQPKLAAPFVDQLAGQALDQEAKAALVNRFDSAALMRLAGNPDLREKLGPFIDDLFRSAAAYRHDPARLAEWAKGLTDADEAARARATVALLQAREDAVAPLVAILADPARAAEHARARELLVQLGDAAIEPLVGVLESPDAALKVQVIEVLGALRAQRAVVRLLAPLVSPGGTPELRAAAARAIERISGRAPDHAEAIQLLEHAATRHLRQSRDESLDGPPLVTVWHWNPAARQSVPYIYDRTGQTLSTAVRLAYDLAMLDPANAARRRLYLVALLQEAKLAGGLDKPLANQPGSAYATAAAQGVDAVESVLVAALAEGYIPAATAAAQILGDIGTPDLLARGGTRPAPLAEAAGHADRRLRFAATEAILKLKPAEPFAGSSRVTQGLGFFAGSYGRPRILVAHPLSAEAGKIAGLARALGYEADIATNGRQAFELAVAAPDYELIFIHSAIDRPPADELLAQLRRDRRTAMLPIGFVAPIDRLERMQDFARRAGRSIALLQPQNEAEMRILVGDVLAHAGRSYVAAAERKAQAIVALDGLVALAQSPQRVFDVGPLEPSIVGLIYLPEVAPRVIELLGDMGTDKAQRALVELADTAAQPLALRKAAVAALARSVRRHGILLASDEIIRQYDIFNTNAGANAETHEVLGAVLDVIEHKGAPPAEPAS